MLAATEKQKLVYILNRDAQAKITISSPLEDVKFRTKPPYQTTYQTTAVHQKERVQDQDQDQDDEQEIVRSPSQPILVIASHPLNGWIWFGKGLRCYDNW